MMVLLQRRKKLSKRYKLFLGDCLEVMKKIPDKSIDCIICDLPYGKLDTKWDIVIPFELLWEQYKRIRKDNSAVVLFGSEPFSSMSRMSNLKEYRYDWVWKKSTNTNFAQAPYMPLKNCENIIVFSKGTIASNSKNKMIYNPQGVQKIEKSVKGRTENAYRLGRTKQKDYIQKGTNYPKMLIEFSNDLLGLHPTQKPVALLEYLVKTYTNENDIVLDNCMGSGSTGVACINTNRKFIGIEKEEKYFNIAKERIEKTEKEYNERT